MSSTYLDVLARTYDGSSESALEINKWIGWQLPGIIGESRRYVRNNVLPQFARVREALKNVPAEDSSLVEGVLKKVNLGARVVRHYIKTGGFKAISDRRFRELSTGCNKTQFFMNF